MSTLRLFVVRHGETVWVRERRFAGSRDIPLTEAGRRQCAAVARALAGSVVAEGLTGEEVRTRFPEAWEQWRSAPHLCKLSGGDTLSGVAERVAAGLEELREAHAGQTVVLVSHAIVARVIVLAALGLGLDRLWTVDAAPAGITEIEYQPDWATVHRMNTVAHLDTVAP